MVDPFAADTYVPQNCRNPSEVNHHHTSNDLVNSNIIHLVALDIIVYKRSYYPESSECIGITYQNVTKNIGYWMGKLATTFCSGVAKLAHTIGNLAPAQICITFVQV